MVRRGSPQTPDTNVFVGCASRTGQSRNVSRKACPFDKLRALSEIEGTPKRQEQKFRSTKLRNKFKMMKNNYNAPNGEDRIRCFGFYVFEFIWPRFVSVRGASFVLRISDLFRWMLGAMIIFVTSVKRIICQRQVLRLRSVKTGALMELYTLLISLRPHSDARRATGHGA